MNYSVFFRQFCWSIGEFPWVFLTKNVFAPLATMASVHAISDAIQGKIRGRLVVRAEKVFTLVNLNEDIDVIIIIKSLENSDVLTDEVSEIVKHEKKIRRWISWYVIRNLKCTNVRKMLTGKGVMRAGRRS